MVRWRRDEAFFGNVIRWIGRIREDILTRFQEINVLQAYLLKKIVYFSNSISWIVLAFGDAYKSSLRKWILLIIREFIS
jgi:hypothetical protein